MTDASLNLERLAELAESGECCVLHNFTLDRLVKMARQGLPGPEDFSVTEQLRAADEAASVAHDFIHGLSGVTKEQASAAIWAIHNALRPLFEVTDLGY